MNAAALEASMIGSPAPVVSDSANESARAAVCAASAIACTVEFTGVVKRLLALRAACPLVERLNLPFLAFCFFRAWGPMLCLFVLRVDGPQD